MRIIIYSTTTCPFCKMLKGYFTEKGVLYTEKIVDQDIKAQEEMIKESDGFTGVPFTVITKDDGTKVTVKGFDKKLIDQTLGVH